MTQPAVLESEAAVVEAAPAPVDVPELDLLEAPDQDSLESPEAPEAEADPYDGLTPAEAAARAREGLLTPEEAESRKDEALRRQRESILTEQREAAAVQAAWQQLNQTMAAASAENRARLQLQLETFVQEGEYEPEQFTALVAELDRGSLGRAMGSVRGAADQYFQAAGIGQIPPQYEAEYLKAAAQGNHVAAFYALANVVAGHYFEQGRQAQSTAAAQAAAQAEAAATEAKKLQNERAGARAPVSPSGGGGRPGRAISSMAEADVAYNADQITHEQYKALRLKFGVDA